MNEARETRSTREVISQQLPLLALAGTTVLCIIVTVVSLLSGWFIIFQNLYYIPIIIACIFFRWKGFFFSALLAGVYLALFAAFTRDPAMLQQAIIRVALFILIAGVITFLALARERTERALRESEEKYRTLIANIPEVTYRCTSEDGMMISFVSDAVQPLTGYPVSDFIGNANRSYDSIVHPDDREQRAAAIQAAVLAKKPYTAEYRLLHADGGTVYMQEQGQGIFDLHGKLTSVDGIILDVTGRKHAEERERLHAARMQALLSLHQMIGVPEKVLLDYVMNTSLAITASRYAFIGLMSGDESVMTIHAWSENAMADCTMVEKPVTFTIAGSGLWGECVRNRAPLIINDYSSPHPAKHGYPGGHVPITRYMGIPIFEGLRIAAVLAVANRGEPYTEEDADILLVLGNQMWEILQRKRVMEELRLKDSAIESSINAIALADTSGILTHVNPAFLRIGEYEKPEDVLGRSAASFIREPAEAVEVLDALREHGSWSGEVEAKKKDGSPVFVQVLANRILDPDGDTVALMAALVDITEWRAMEQEREFHAQELARYSTSLTEVNRKLNLLSSITRHDILNQLLVLLGYLSLSRDYLEDREQLLDCIEKQEQAAKNIQNQITFTREYQNMGVQAPVWHSLQEVADSVKAALMCSDIRIDTNLARIAVYADPLLERVFYNLIENAIKYGGDTMTSIRLYAEESGDTPRIICEDDGVGVPPEEKARLFERGFGKGTGLGLFLSREILAITGITITETGEPGRGARFEIHVPRGQFRRTV